jgi:uncharacterized membrane protein YedE/YeeE
MISLLWTFFAGLTFGLGLGIAGMTLPANVIAFLDITGPWNPSLAIVMLGAIGVHSLTYRLIRKRARPLFGPRFYVPVNQHIDRRLILGSLLFGVGWGLGGFCPGPALVASVSSVPAVMVFLASLIGGVYLHEIFRKSRYFNRI